MKRVLLAVCAALIVSTPRVSRADAKDECIEAHEHAQQLRNAGKLKAARKALLTCSRSECPALILKDCTPWLDASRNEQPSVVVAVHDEHGVETSDVSVFVDGELVATRLDGRPIDVDPGEHALRFERPAQAPLEQRVFLRVGEHERLVSVSFPRATETTKPIEAPKARTSRWSAGAVVTGIIGIAGLGLFAGFGVSGKIEESNLASTCKPNCSGSQIDDVRTQYIVAYASLGVGVVALAVSIGLLASAPTRTARVAWAIAPIGGGGVAAVLGRF